MPKGRPHKYDRKDIFEKLTAYIDKWTIPILAEFAVEYGIVRERLYEIAAKDENISYAIKRLHDKKEAGLEREGLEGNIDRGIAIFSLKQLGWRDHKQLEEKLEDQNEKLSKIAGELEKLDTNSK